LAEAVGKWAQEPDSRGQMSPPSFVSFALSFDAWASKRTATMGDNPNSVAMRMAPVFRDYGITAPHASTRDKLGRDTLMLELMEKRVRVSEDGEGHPIKMPAWRISDRCSQLKRVIPVAKRDDVLVEQIESPGDGSDSPLQGCGYGLYAIFGRPAEKPLELRRQEIWDSYPSSVPVHNRVMQIRRFDADHAPRRSSRGRSTWVR
jgi:hypothetical protein